MKLIRALVGICLIGWWSMACAANTQVQQLRLAAKPNQLQLIFELNQAPDYRSFALTHPDRIVVDIQQAKMTFDLKRVQLAHPVLQVRQAQQDKTLRLVIDLANESQYRVFALKPQANYGHRLVVEIKKDQGAPTATAKQTAPLKSAPREVVIIIDPGHGGKDPGAIGPKGTQEKNVVLAIGKALTKLINQEPGMKAVLTRDSDRYVGLRQRLAIARKHNADLFVSVHADAFKHSSANGASVFALSQRGATSEAARWLAEKENHADLGGINLQEFEDELVRSVLIDLSQTATISASLTVGGGVLSQLGKVARLHNHKVDQAGFLVLKSPDIPSILVEMGFISNPTEELNLGSRRYRQRLAKAVYQGIKQYLYASPPPNTIIAGLAKATSYKVTRGDSLSHIAQRHGVSVRALKAANQLTSDNIRVGQTLKIPHG
ncbi:MAG: AMIN domain-containing protein [Legionellales bacterium]|nr:AMIN domain-containing protein [Legionellales bacterium]